MWLERDYNLSDLMNIEQPYINYEKKIPVDEGEIGMGARISRNGQAPQKDNHLRREDICHGTDPCSSPTSPLKTLREKIWKQHANIEFKDADIMNPYPVREQFSIDKSKYCCFQKIHVHNTN